MIMGMIMEILDSKNDDDNHTHNNTEISKNEP